MPFAKTKCAINLSNAASGLIEPGKLNELFDRIDQQKDSGILSEIADRESKKFADRAEYDAFNQKRTAILNAVARRKMKLTTGGWMKKGMDPATALEAYSLGTSSHPGIGTRYNAASMRRSIVDRENSIAFNQLRKAGADKHVTSGKFEDALAEAKAKLSNPAQQTPHLDGLAGPDRQAIEAAAKILNDQQTRLRKWSAAKGAFISERPGFIASQTHDRAKIRSAARQQNALSILLHGDRPTEADRTTYLKDLQGMLDIEGTRRNLVRQGRLGEAESLDPQKFAQSLWEVFSTGVRKEGKGDGAGLTGFPGNVAAQAEKGRLLEFKDPSSWVAYNQKYGSGGIWQAHLNQIKQMAHTIATLDFFGPSAENNFSRVVEDTRQDLRGRLNQATVGTGGEAARANKTAADYLGEIPKEKLDQYLALKPVKVESRFKGSPVSVIRRLIREWAKENVNGKVQVPALGKDVTITANGVKKATSGTRPNAKEHLEAVAGLPDMLKQAVLAESHADRKGDPNILSMHRLISPVEVDGRVFDVKLTVKEAQDGSVFYDHRLTQIKERPARATQMGAPEGDAASNTQEAGLPEPTPAMDPAQVEKLHGQLDKLQGSHAESYFNTYLGINHEPGNMTLDRMVNGVMAWNRMAHLGGALFTNFEAATTSFLQMHYAGVPLLRAAFRPLFAGLERMPRAELNDFVRRMGAGSMGLFSQAAQHVAGTSAEPGAMMKRFENVFFKGTGLSQFMDMIRNNYVFALNNEMAHNAGSGFADLPAKMQRHLGDYNISPAEWDVIRQHAATKVDGYDMLAPDLIRNAPDEDFHGIAGSTTPFAVNNARLDAEMKLHNLFIDSADYASVMHDLKTHAMIGQYAGHGLIGRMALQFQTFPVAHGQKVISRAWASQSFPEFFFKTVGALVLTGILTGETKELLAGRNMLANPDLWQDDDKGKAAAGWGKMIALGAARSGAAAFLGDAIFSQNYLSGHNPDSAIPGLLGPTGETFTHAASLVYKAAFKGKVDGPDVARFVQGNTPFINTWWVKPLINYGLMYGLQEHLAPGTLNRMEQKSQEEGNPFWLPPSEFAHQW